MIRRLAVAASAALLLAQGCSGAPGPAALPGPQGPANPMRARAAVPIQHVVIIVQENRSFDNLFMGFPGANTTTTGLAHDGSHVPLAPIPLQGDGQGDQDLDHSHNGFEVEFRNGGMDGFDLTHFGANGSGPAAGHYPYAYVERSQTKPYWSLAAKYALSDRTFSTATTGSFVAHQELIAGTDMIDANDALTDWPYGYPWGCDGGSGNRTPTIDVTNGSVNRSGVEPCFTQYRTMADVLDAGGVSWKFYVPPVNGPGSDYAGGLWNAFDAIQAVRFGPDWSTHIVSPNTAIFTDLSGGTLPQVSWVVPRFTDSDHPAAGSDTGPSWVTSVVNAIGKSKYWNDTAIVIVWDDWGGFYDNVKPPKRNVSSLSFRVPLIVVSPYAKPHYVSHVTTEFGSILKYVEQTFHTSSLGATDATANSLNDLLDYKQTPIPYKAIAAPYDRSYFLRPRKLPSAKEIIDRDGFPG